mmetsp:Transcript_40336/g.124599  ORF Transcript_40336/g.124599 Transcript_40336/m.124599 type:complete len:434 (+) Transcript_40336:95-1396(+)
MLNPSKCRRLRRAASVTSGGCRSNPAPSGVTTCSVHSAWWTRASKRKMLCASASASSTASLLCAAAAPWKEARRVPPMLRAEAAVEWNAFSSRALFANVCHAGAGGAGGCPPAVEFAAETRRTDATPGGRSGCGAGECCCVPCPVRDRGVAMPEGATECTADSMFDGDSLGACSSACARMAFSSTDGGTCVMRITVRICCTRSLCDCTEWGMTRVAPSGYSTAKSSRACKSRQCMLSTRSRRPKKVSCCSCAVSRCCRAAKASRSCSAAPLATLATCSLRYPARFSPSRSTMRSSVEPRSRSAPIGCVRMSHEPRLRSETSSESSSGSHGVRYGKRSRKSASAALHVAMPLAVSPCWSCVGARASSAWSRRLWQPRESGTAELDGIAASAACPCRAPAPWRCCCCASRFTVPLCDTPLRCSRSVAWLTQRRLR